jgi:PKD repeat protein
MPVQPVTFIANNFFSASLLWDFDDAPPFNGGPRQVHAFREAGTHRVVVRDWDGKSVVPITVRVPVGGSPSIEYAPSEPSVNDPVEFRAVNFTSTSLVRWDFGDGAVENDTSPPLITHAYRNPGTYSVRAFDGGSGSPTAQISVKVLAERLITFSPADPRAGEEITFRAVNFSSRTLRWDFGDGTVLSAGTQVTHAYVSPRTYSVRAFDGGSGSPTAQISVKVLPERLITFSPADPRAGEEITFKAINFSSPTLRWDFGDGTVLSAGAQVTHVFKTAGPWTIKAFDRSGSAEVAKSLSITVFPSQGPRSKFAISFIQLRFEDGKSYKVVPRGFGALTAFAEIKFEGTGVLQTQWLVDGMPFKTVFTNLSFAGSTIIDSGRVPGLPSLIPGLHEVTLHFMQPPAEFEVPVIRYFVTADAVPREAVDFLLDGAVTIDGAALGGDDATIEAPVGKHFLLKGWVRNESGTAVAFALLRVFLDDVLVDQKIVQDLKPGEERGFESSVFNPTAGRKRLVLALYDISRRPAAILYLREISVVPPK